MKRKIQVFLFILTITFTLLITICISIKTKGDDESTQNIEALVENSSLYSETILPPGSTSTDLQNAINNAISGDTIVISGDMTFSSMVTIPTNKTIIIQSTSGNNWTLYPISAISELIQVNGSLVLQHITIDGAGTSCGISIYANGNFTMNENTIIQNCYSSGIGSAIWVNEGTSVMNGGTITNNKNGYGRYCRYI